MLLLLLWPETRSLMKTSNHSHHRRTGSLSHRLDSSLRMKLCCFVGVVVYFLSMCVFANDTLEYSAYCQNLCTWGRGGNVCRCSAVHFAGKRAAAGSSDRELSAAAATGDRLGLDVAQPENTTRPVKGLLLVFMLQRIKQQQQEAGFLHRKDVPDIIPLTHTGLSHTRADRSRPVLDSTLDGFERPFPLIDAGLHRNDDLVHAVHRSPAAFEVGLRVYA